MQELRLDLLQVPCLRVALKVINRKIMSVYLVVALDLVVVMVLIIPKFIYLDFIISEVLAEYLDQPLFIEASLAEDNAVAVGVSMDVI